MTPSGAEVVPFPAAVVDAVELPVASGCAAVVVDTTVVPFPAIAVVDAVELPAAAGSAAVVVDTVVPFPAIVVDVVDPFRRAWRPRKTTSS